MFTEMILLQHAFSWKIPQSRSLCLLSLRTLSRSSRPPFIPRDVCNTSGTRCSHQPPFLSWAIPHPFTLNTRSWAFQSQSGLFSCIFPSSHLCSSWSLYFENFSFNCSQANNHISIASFSMKPPVSHPPVHSHLPHVPVTYWRKLALLKLKKVMRH